MFEKFKVNSGMLIKALGKTAGAKLGKIVIARLVFAKAGKMIRVIIKLIHLIKTGTGGNVKLTADNGLYARFFCGAVKVDNPVHNAVVGYCNCILPKVLDVLTKPVDTAGAVKQTVFGMNV